MSGEQEGDAILAFAEMKDSLPPNVAAIAESHANSIIKIYHPGNESGKVVLLYLACKIAAMAESGEL